MFIQPLRSVASATLAGIGIASIIFTSIGPLPPSRTVAAAPSSGTAAAVQNATREFTLVAQEVDWELFPGTTVRAWTYNGSMPGPEIRVTEGDLVRVTLKNELPVPTVIHWHGIDVPFAMDGVPGLTQDAVPPGGTFVYEFPATNPGTRWYHSHQDAEVQGHLGLYGPMIVEPKTPPAGPKYDREYTYTLSEWSLALTPAVAKGEASLPRTGPGAPHSKQMDFDFFLMNGKAHQSIPPVLVKQGERVRIRLINAGSIMHTIHTHGHSFKIVATDGNPVPEVAQLTKDSVTLGPSERVDIELLANNPGIWMFHCHMEHHMSNGMMTTIRYEGVEPLVGGVAHLAASAPLPAAASHNHSAHATHGTVTLATAAPVAAGAPAPVPATQAVPGAAATINMVDNRFQPATVTVPVGASVAWVNNGVNIHTVSSYDGSVESGSIQPGEAFTYTFSKPGTYQYLCRQHLLNGMTGTILVQ
jgi:FtsP/CotA-like multicopper oxidase with cupredoxin domain